MARSQARIHTSVWRNRDFTNLPASAQATYWMVLAQADVNMAGVVAYMPHRWASFRGDPHRLEDDVETLERTDFLIIDRDTHEVWIRSFAKNDGALRSETTRKSMWTAWNGVLSPTIRRRFIHQLDQHIIDEATSKGWVTETDIRDALAPPPDTPPDGAPHGAPDTPPDAPSTPHADGHTEWPETDTPSHGVPDGGPRARLPSTTTSTSPPARAREAADADLPSANPDPDGGGDLQGPPQPQDPLEHYRARTIGRLPAKVQRAIDADSASARGKLEANLIAASDEGVPIGRVWDQLNDSDLLAQDVKSVAATAAVRIRRAIEEHADA